MTSTPTIATDARGALARIQKGLRMLTVPLPHLAGLAAAVHVNIDDRVPTMGVFASGRLLANPDFTARLTDDVLPSLGRLVAGYALAALLGVALGTAVGSLRTAARTVVSPMFFSWLTATVLPARSLADVTGLPAWTRTALLAWKMAGSPGPARVKMRRVPKLKKPSIAAGAFSPLV